MRSVGSKRNAHTKRNPPTLEQELIMNAKSIAIAAVAFAAFGAASAQEVTPEYALPQPVVVHLSRAEVRQATLAALRAGQIVNGERTYVAPTVSTASRAQVRAEAIAANRLGLIRDGELEVVATPWQLEQISAAGQVS
jgi:hypothetical protein